MHETHFSTQEFSMTISLTKRSFVAALALAGLSIHSQAADPVKVGFVFFGTPGDGGWTYAHSIAVKEAQKTLGNKIAVTIVEDVPENADAERVIRDLASKGNQYIFTTSFGYMEQTLKVGKSFPKVEFYHNTGFKSSPNVHIYNSRMYEPAYLAGIIAGRMTKSNTLGYVASFPIPEVVRNINAYTMGARSVNPNVKTKVVWISSWYDPAKERQAAETLIGQGADMLLQNTDSTATMQTAAEKGVFAFGWNSDMSAVSPKAHLASVTQLWGSYYTKVLTAATEGKPFKENVWGGMKEGMNGLSSVSKLVPAAVQKEVDAKKADLVAGKFKVFAGPLKLQDGSIKLQAGQAMTDSEIDSIKFYVEGVEGQLPN
jgi:simple sugar transport system substrate-binding protein